MPKIGQICQSRERGLSGHSSCIWINCVDCGLGFWASYYAFRNHKSFTGLCLTCNGERQTKAIATRRPLKMQTKDGYIHLFLRPDNPFYAMACKKDYGGYVREHRLVIAQHLNRCLKPWEIVHHINGVKDDNRIENLELLSNNAHTRKIWEKINELKVHVVEQDKQIRLLQWQVKKLNQQLLEVRL